MNAGSSMETLTNKNDAEEQRRKVRTAAWKLLAGGLLGGPAYVLTALYTSGHLKPVPTVIAGAACLLFVILGARALIITRR